MFGTSAAGAVGIIVQVALFVIVALYASRSRGLSRGVVYGGVVAVYGYALVIAFVSLLGIPWQVVNGALALFLAILATRTSVRRVVQDELPGALTKVRRSWAASTIVAAVAAFTILVAALEPDLSVDGQLYHGPVLATIVQSGSLWGWAAPNQYLYYTDLTMAGGVNLATFAGDARFDNAIQVPHLLLLIVAISWVLGRRYTSSFARVSFATLIVAAPVIWMQPRILYVDLAYGTAVMIAILMIVAVREFAGLDVVVAGIAVSAVFATKPAGILTGAILLAALVVAVLARRMGVASWKASLGLLAAGLGPALVMGTSFYLRNLVTFANPFYPIKANFGPVALPGILDLSVFASGDRGSGLIDVSRLRYYGGSVVRGMLHGVEKADYDPRAGGYGHTPLVVLVLAVALLTVTLLRRRRAIPGVERQRIDWRVPVAMVGLVAVTLAIQPSTFDTRYVIGPTVALLTALLLVVAIPMPSLVQALAGVFALVMAVVQISWTENFVVPGVRSSVDALTADPGWLPISPAGPGSRPGVAVAWLPDRCASIALETSGGVKAHGAAGGPGLDEESYLGSQPYALYGDALCNRVYPITLDDASDDTASLVGADFVLLYTDHVAVWAKEFPTTFGCLVRVDKVKSSHFYLQDVTVFRDTCR